MVNDNKNDKEEHSIKNSYTLIALKIERFKKYLKRVIFSDKMNGEIYSYDIISMFLDKLSDAILSTVNPVIVSKRFFDRIRKSFIVKNEIKRLNEKKEELVMAIIGILPEETSYESCIKTGDKIKEVIENPDFIKEFEKINKVFEDLSPKEQKNLMIHTAKVINKSFFQMESVITKKAIEVSDPGNVLLLGRTLSYARYLTNEFIDVVKRRPDEKEHISFCLNCVMILLTKILAIYFKKMEYEDLYEDLSFITLYIYDTNPEYFGNLENVDRSIFTMLGDESA